MRKISRKVFAALLTLAMIVSLITGLAGTTLAAGATPVNSTALNVYYQFGSNPTPTLAKSFTYDELKSYASTTLANYQYYKNGAWTVVASGSYVTLDALFNAAGVAWVPGCTVKATAASDNFSVTTSYETLQANKYYIPTDSSTPEVVPPAVTLQWYYTDTPGSVYNNFRFCYGIDKYSTTGDAIAGKRLVTNTTDLYVTVPQSYADAIGAAMGGIIAAQQPQLDMDAPALKLYTQNGPDGTPVEAKEFTLGQLHSLSQVSNAAYQFYKDSTWQAVAASRYVSIDAILKDANVTFASGYQIKASGSDGASQTVAYDTLQRNKYYFKDAKTTLQFPAAVAVTWGQGQTQNGEYDGMAKTALENGVLRFAYGTTQKQYEAQTASDTRLVNNLVSLTIISPAQFPDVPADAWFSKYVTSLTSEGVFGGNGSGNFNPNGVTTYGEALKLIMLTAGYPVQQPTGSHWASGYMAKALSRNLIPAAVDLNATISRLEVAQIAAKALELPIKQADSPFSDTDNQYVVTLYGAGIIQGSDGKFNPDSSITRAELSSILWKMENGAK